MTYSPADASCRHDSLHRRLATKAKGGKQEKVCQVTHGIIREMKESPPTPRSCWGMVVTREASKIVRANKDTSSLPRMQWQRCLIGRRRLPPFPSINVDKNIIYQHCTFAMKAKYSSQSQLSAYHNMDSSRTPHVAVTSRS